MGMLTFIGLVSWATASKRSVWLNWIQRYRARTRDAHKKKRASRETDNLRTTSLLRRSSRRIATTRWQERRSRMLLDQKRLTSVSQARRSTKQQVSRTFESNDGLLYCISAKTVQMENVLEQLEQERNGFALSGGSMKNSYKDFQKPWTDKSKSQKWQAMHFRILLETTLLLASLQNCHRFSWSQSRQLRKLRKKKKLRSIGETCVCLSSAINYSISRNNSDWSARRRKCSKSGGTSFLKEKRLMLTWAKWIWETMKKSVLSKGGALNFFLKWILVDFNP